MSDEHLIESKIDSKLVYQGTFLKINQDRVCLPDGKEAIREYAVHSGAVMVLPVFADGRVLLERQYRYPMQRVMLEFPAGKLDPNEITLNCAKRELHEETGYTAQSWQYITRINPGISYSTEFIEIFLAMDLQGGKPQLDEGEFLETLILPFEELLEKVKQGEVTDVKTIIGTFWLEKLLNGTWSKEGKSD